MSSNSATPRPEKTPGRTTATRLSGLLGSMFSPTPAKEPARLENVANTNSMPQQQQQLAPAAAAPSPWRQMPLTRRETHNDRGSTAAATALATRASPTRALLAALPRPKKKRTHQKFNLQSSIWANRTVKRQRTSSPDKSHQVAKDVRNAYQKTQRQVVDTVEQRVQSINIGHKTLNPDISRMRQGVSSLDIRYTTATAGIPKDDSRPAPSVPAPAAAQQKTYDPDGPFLFQTTTEPPLSTATAGTTPPGLVLLNPAPAQHDDLVGFMEPFEPPPTDVNPHKKKRKETTSAAKPAGEEKKADDNDSTKWTCPSCHALNPDDERVCLQCQKERPAVEAAEGWGSLFANHNVGQYKCKGCYSYFDDNLDQCPACELKRFGGQPSEDVSPNEASPPAPDGTAVPTFDFLSNIKTTTEPYNFGATPAASTLTGGIKFGVTDDAQPSTSNGGTTTTGVSVTFGVTPPAPSSEPAASSSTTGGSISFGVTPPVAQPPAPSEGTTGPSTMGGFQVGLSSGATAVGKAAAPFSFTAQVPAATFTNAASKASQDTEKADDEKTDNQTASISFTAPKTDAKKDSQSQSIPSFTAPAAKSVFQFTSPVAAPAPAASGNDDGDASRKKERRSEPSPTNGESTVSGFSAQPTTVTMTGNSFSFDKPKTEAVSQSSQGASSNDAKPSFLGFSAAPSGQTTNAAPAATVPPSANLFQAPAAPPGGDAPKEEDQNRLGATGGGGTLSFGSTSVVPASGGSLFAPPALAGPSSGTAVNAFGGFGMVAPAPPIGPLFGTAAPAPAGFGTVAPAPSGSAFGAQPFNFSAGQSAPSSGFGSDPSLASRSAAAASGSSFGSSSALSFPQAPDQSATSLFGSAPAAGQAANAFSGAPGQGGGVFGKQTAPMFGNASTSFGTAPGGFNQNTGMFGQPPVPAFPMNAGVAPPPAEQQGGFQMGQPRPKRRIVRAKRPTR